MCVLLEFLQKASYYEPTIMVHDTNGFSSSLESTNSFVSFLYHEANMYYVCLVTLW